MKLRAYKIGNVTYFCNELQIKEAGSLERAAKIEHEKANPIRAMKPKAAKAEVQESEPKKE